MSTSSNDDQSDHQSAVAFSGPHSFVRSSIKSVVKALSGRRQSPSPTFQRSSMRVVGDAEKTDQDSISGQLQLASDKSEGLLLSETEVRPDQNDSRENDGVHLKLLKIRSLHGNDQGQENLNDSPGVRESRYFGNLPDLQSSDLGFHVSGNAFDGGLGHLASPHSPHTPSLFADKMNEGAKESRRREVIGTMLPFGSQLIVLRCVSVGANSFV
jgi:hypothetical protein